MTKDKKLKLSNALTMLTAVFASIQGLITNPPFTDHSILVIGAVLTYLTLIATAGKQVLSPEVSDKGWQWTLIIFLVASLAGLLDLIKVFDLSTNLEQWIRFFISFTIMILNICSKILFPSYYQKNRIKNLKS